MKICPKCNSSNIMGPKKVGGESFIRIMLSSWKTATLVSFVCVDCGYCEFYSDEKGLENIKIEFEKNPNEGIW